MEVEPKRLVVALGLVFLLGVGFALINSWYAREEGSALPLLVYAIAFVSLALGAFLVVLFQWRISRAQARRMLKVLPAEERRIVELLMDHAGSLEQNKLVALSGFGKVKVSRIVKHLELRGVVKKAPLGNTNLIVLDL